MIRVMYAITLMLAGLAGLTYFIGHDMRDLEQLEQIKRLESENKRLQQLVENSSKYVVRHCGGGLEKTKNH